MRRMCWLLLVLAGCGGADSDPVKVAERFHERRLAGDDGGIHALLTTADRAAVPLALFPAALPARLALELSGLGSTALDSVSLLSLERDTAAVVLHASGSAPDTIRLLATHDPLSLWLFELDRVRWRVSLGLAERALLDSLAASMRRTSAGADSAATEHARAYLGAAGRYPALARPADVDAASSTVRRAEVVEALRIELRVVAGFTGAHFVEGHIENPTRNHVSTLRLTVRDAAGAEDRVELWDMAPGSTTPVRQLTRLRAGPVEHRVDRTQVF